MMPTAPIRLALVNDYELVIAGLANTLTPYADRVVIVELDANTFPEAEVDIVLYDTFGQAQGDRMPMRELCGDGSSRVVVFTWNVGSELIDEAMAAGVSGYIAKTASAEDLVGAIEAVHRGETIVLIPDGEEGLGRWPGDEHGLSNREAEVLALVTQGMTNKEIYEQTHISPNTLKTYIRNLYRKIGVTSRSQAVLWGIEHGFTPDHVRRNLRP